jgi:hypothetical protein
MARQPPTRAFRAGLVTLRERVEHRRRFVGGRDFEDRRKRSDRVVMILAGYKSYLWPWTLDRMARFMPGDVDVCITSSGVHSAELADFARERGWSYLATHQNRVPLAQNLTIQAHPDARYVTKLDEDIFVGEGFFEALAGGYDRIKAEQRFRPGICSPILNVNGNTYVPFLHAMGLSDEYEARFGPLTQASGALPCTDTGEGARWLWERSLPFDRTAALFAEQPFAYSGVPHRFSIGAITFERDLWELMEGFWAAPEGPGLGADEEQFARVCMTHSRPIVVIENLFAGHFAFGPQEADMRAALPDLEAGLALDDQAAAARRTA